MLRGNVADMGIGIVLGAAFSGLVDSLVKDVLLPPFGVLLAKMNFSNLFIPLGGGHYTSLAEAQEAGAATINYGLFLTSFIRFVIVLFVIFIVVRQMNKWKKPDQHPADAMTKKECPFCRLPIPSQATKCPNCSSDIDEPPQRKRLTSKDAVRLRIK